MIGNVLWDLIKKKQFLPSGLRDNISDIVFFYMNIVIIFESSKKFITLSFICFLLIRKKQFIILYRFFNFDSFRMNFILKIDTVRILFF